MKIFNLYFKKYLSRNGKKKMFVCKLCETESDIKLNS